MYLHLVLKADMAPNVSFKFLNNALILFGRFFELAFRLLTIFDHVNQGFLHALLN